MIHLVLRAFGTACVAHFSTKLADSFCELRAACHFAFAERTQVRATAIQFDAASHHFDVVLVQARRCTMFARDEALVAGFNAILIFFVRHDVIVVCCSAARRPRRGIRL